MYSDDEEYELTKYKDYINNDLLSIQKKHRRNKVLAVPLNVAQLTDRLNAALFYAYRSGNTRTINYQIRHNPTIVIDWDYGLSGAAMGGHMHLVKRAIKHGARDFIDGLRSACSQGHLEIAKLMLLHIKPGMHTYARACRKGHVDIIKLLLSQDHTDAQLCVGLEHACEAGHAQIVKILLDARENLRGDTPLKIPDLEFTNVAILKMLIDYNYLDNYSGITLLHVGELLDHGMSIEWFMRNEAKLAKDVNYEIRRLRKKIADCINVLNVVCKFPVVLIPIITSYIEWNTL